MSVNRVPISLQYQYFIIIIIVNIIIIVVIITVVVVIRAAVIVSIMITLGITVDKRDCHYHLCYLLLQSLL